MAILAKYGFEEVADVLRSRFVIKFGTRAARPPVPPEVQARTRAARLRLAMEELGPTFIKLGQLLSTRPDLIPIEYVKELEQLQDRVAPDSFDLIRGEVEKELHGKLEDIFLFFDHAPLAAASIAQVHRATTKEGKSAVVKVRRPGISKKIRIECEILADLAALLKATIFKDEPVDPVIMVQEFTEAITKEVDFNNERRNQIRFANAFADDPAIHVPDVYEKYCSEGVLTMEYIDGIRPSNRDAIILADLDPVLIADRGANFVLKQIFDFGFFHADPHPGNFFLLPENVLVPIDFGQVAWLSKADRVLLTEMVLALVENETSRMIHAFEHAGMISNKTDVDRLIRDIEQNLAAYYNMPLKEIPFNKLLMQTFDLMRKHYVRPPAQFTLMLKSLMTIESFALGLDPSFDILSHLKPYASKFSKGPFDPQQILTNARNLFKDAANLASNLPDDLNSIISKFRQGKLEMRIHHEHLENLVKTVDKSSDRISFSLISAALLIASSMLVSQEGRVLGLFTLETLGVVGYLVAAIIGFWLIISILRGKYL